MQLRSIILIGILCFVSTQLFAQTDPQPAKKPVRLSVNGSLTPEGMERVGKPITSIDREEIKKSTSTSLGDLLSSQVGISSSSFGPAAGRPIIRGQSKERVRVLENGLDVGDVSSYSDDHAVSMDPLLADRIEILRGPSTLLYGGQAIGGVVNTIDRSISEYNLGKEFSGVLDLKQGDSADEESSAAGLLEGEVNSWNWHLSGFYKETDDIEIPGYAESAALRESEEHASEHDAEDEVKGTLPNSDLQNRGFKAGLSKVWDKGFWGVSLRRSQSNYGIPAGHEHSDEHEAEHDHESELMSTIEEPHDSHSEEIAAEAVRLDLDQTRVETRGEVELDHHFFKKIRTNLAYSDYQHKELEGEAVGTRFNRELFEGRLLLSHSHDETYEGGWGAQMTHDKFSASGEEAFIPSTTSFSPALFMVEDFKLDQQNIWQVGGRYEYFNLDPETDLESKDFDLVSASTGLINFTKEKTYSSALNFSYSERAPNSTELFADGVHTATQTYEVGDQNLQKERAIGTELIFRKLKGLVRGSTSIFGQKYFDYINLQPTGQELEGAQVMNYEQIQASFWGAEVEVEYDLVASAKNTLTSYSSIDYVRGKNETEDRNLPRITPLRYKTGLRYTRDRIGSFVEGVFAAEQNDTADFELPTDNYSVLNAGASYRLTQEYQPGAELYIRATNLTDEEVRLHTSVLKDQVPLRGRALLAGITVNF